MKLTFSHEPFQRLPSVHVLHRSAGFRMTVQKPGADRYDRWVRSAVKDAVHSRERVGGLTHGLYRYPARFPPEFVRAAIRELTAPGDWILDPFIGGGTTAIEALAAGRRVAGIDLNPLAVLLSRAKTTPLYGKDESVLSEWATGEPRFQPVIDRRTKNAPSHIIDTLGPLVAAADGLASARQQDVARALLVHVGQWALDGRERQVEQEAVRLRLQQTLDAHLAGVRSLTNEFSSYGHRPSDIGRWRLLRHGSASHVGSGRAWNRLSGRIKLLLTSPPYPGVHVLYHRWQVYGRAETALPYWLSGLQDGMGESHYTMGGRSVKGELEYFETIERTYRALKRLLRPDARVVQLVAFHDEESQLPRYLDVMRAAGYTARGTRHLVARDVPNRRWYYRVAPQRGNAREFLLVHQPTR